MFAPAEYKTFIYRFVKVNVWPKAINIYAKRKFKREAKNTTPKSVKTELT